MAIWINNMSPNINQLKQLSFIFNKCFNCLVNKMKKDYHNTLRICIKIKLTTLMQKNGKLK